MHGYRYRRDDVEPPPLERELLLLLLPLERELPELKPPLDDERDVDEPIVLRLLDDELLDDELLWRVVMPLLVEPSELLLRVVEVLPPDTLVPEDFEVPDEPDDKEPLLRVVEVL